MWGWARMQTKRSFRRAVFFGDRIVWAGWLWQCWGRNRTVVARSWLTLRFCWSRRALRTTVPCRLGDWSKMRRRQRTCKCIVVLEGWGLWGLWFVAVGSREKLRTWYFIFEWCRQAGNGPVGVGLHESAPGKLQKAWWQLYRGTEANA